MTLDDDFAQAWCGGLRVGPVGTMAWFGRIDDIALPLLAPTASDSADAGHRSGEALRLFLARRSALRHLVAWRLEVEAETVVIGYDGQGAPRVRAPRSDVFVSVSGRGSGAGLAVGPRPVGVDIEPLEPNVDLPRAVLAPAERERIEALPQSRRAVAFLHHWTAKEAYLKALGTGLLRDPAEVAVCWPDASDFSIRDGGRAVAGEGTVSSFEANMQTIVAACFVAIDANRP